MGIPKIIIMDLNVHKETWQTSALKRMGIPSIIIMDLTVHKETWQTSALKEWVFLVL